MEMLLLAGQPLHHSNKGWCNKQYTSPLEEEGSICIFNRYRN